IDHGKNFTTSVTDQRGLTRTIDYPGVASAAGGDGTDIGAFEVQAVLFDTTPPSITCPDDQVVNATSPAGAVVSFAPTTYDSGVKNGLLVKLQDALEGVNTGNKPKACSAMQDFINLCNAQLAKRKLDAVTGNYLIGEATRIRAVTGCK